MNRAANNRAKRGYDKPHARGDEPYAADVSAAARRINPTHVGMNRSLRVKLLSFMNKPHARGDEPLESLEEKIKKA